MRAVAEKGVRLLRHLGGEMRHIGQHQKRGVKEKRRGVDRQKAGRRSPAVSPPQAQHHRAVAAPEVDVAQGHRGGRIVKSFGSGDRERSDALPASERIRQMPARAARVLRQDVPAIFHLEYELLFGERGHGSVRHPMALESNQIVSAELFDFGPCDRSRRLYLHPGHPGFPHDDLGQLHCHGKIRFEPL